MQFECDAGSKNSIIGLGVRFDLGKFLEIVIMSVKADILWLRESTSLTLKFHDRQILQLDSNLAVH